MRFAFILAAACLVPFTAEARDSVMAGRQMVAAAHPLAVEAGLAMLRKGGSAVDAAIAVQAVLGLVEPESSGLGGGAFLLFWDAAARRLTTLDGRETAPAAIAPTVFLRPDGSRMGYYEAAWHGRSIGTPGVMKLMAEAHARHGRLPWAELFAPAIAVAEDGFSVTEKLADVFARVPAERMHVSARAYFFGEDGTPPEAGEVLRSPAYAATLRTIADGGAEAFYSGALAAEMAAAAQAAGGVLGVEDFTAYRVIARDPVCGTYRVWTVCSMGPPSSGGVALLQILGMIEDSTVPHASLAGRHALAQASRLAFADRAIWIGDPAFVEVPVAALTAPGYIVRRSALVSPGRLMGASPAPGDPLDTEEALPFAAGLGPAENGTSHLSIVDAAGNVVSMTTTIEGPFGASVLAGGILLNNQLTDFSFVPEREGKPVANAVAPGKRPRSSMTPVIVFDSAGDPVLTIGSPGGSRIIGYVAQATADILDGMAVQDALDSPHILARDTDLEIEEGTAAEAWAPVFESLGWTVTTPRLNSGLHAIRIHDDGRLEGGADPRRSGIAAGD